MTLAWVVGMLIASHSTSDLVISGDVSIGHTTAQSGFVNLPNDAKQCWRNAADSNDLCLWLDPNDILWTPPRTRHLDINQVTAGKGPTAPDSIQLGTFYCVKFDQSKPGETVTGHFEVPEDWDGGDMALELRFFPETGDALLDGEVVEWDVSYRTITPGETWDSGALAVISATHTQVGSGTDKASARGRVTVPFDDPNQPLIRGGCLTFSADLDEGATTYSGNPNLCLIHFEYESNKLSQ